MTSEKDQSLGAGFFENPLTLCRQTLRWPLLMIADQRKASPEFDLGRLCRLLADGPGVDPFPCLQLRARSFEPTIVSATRYFVLARDRGSSLFLDDEGSHKNDDILNHSRPLLLL